MAKNIVARVQIEKNWTFDLHCGSTSAPHLANNLVYHKLMKHIDADCHIIK